jgi:hypothetical protein
MVVAGAARSPVLGPSADRVTPSQNVADGIKVSRRPIDLKPSESRHARRPPAEIKILQNNPTQSRSFGGD